jgi:hypothetical protein
MGCSMVRRQDPVKKIIILPVGSYRSLRRRIRWGLLFNAGLAVSVHQTQRSRSRQGGKEK